MHLCCYHVDGDAFWEELGGDGEEWGHVHGWTNTRNCTQKYAHHNEPPGRWNVNDKPASAKKYLYSTVAKSDHSSTWRGEDLTHANRMYEGPTNSKPKRTGKTTPTEGSCMRISVNMSYSYLLVEHSLDSQQLEKRQPLLLVLWPLWCQ